MKKKIWIINHYASQDYSDQGGRHYWIAKYLKRRGYKPTVFCCNKIHNADGFCADNSKLFTTKVAQDINVPFVFIKGRDYQCNGKDRILNMTDFYFNVKRTAKIYAKRHGKPDIIYASSAHPLALTAGIHLAGKFHVSCICEIRDLWPETFVSYGLMGRNNPIIKFLYKGEKWIYKNADSLIFTMEGGKDYILKKGWEKDVPLSKIFYINNGVDLECFDFYKRRYMVNDDDLINENYFNVVYAGSVRRVNNLDSLLDAAKAIKDKGIRILIWGNGDCAEEIKNRIDKEGISNVLMKGYVSKKYIPGILSKADACLMHGETTKIANYGISPNKLFEYFAAGKPVITTYGGRYNLVTEQAAGFGANVHYPEKYAAVIERMKNLQFDEYEKMCMRSRQMAEEFDFNRLTDRLINIFEDS